MTPTPRDLVPLIKVPDHRPFVTVRWLRRAVSEHRLGCYKLGARVLIDLAELDALVEAGRVEPVL